MKMKLFWIVRREKLNLLIFYDDNLMEALVFSSADFYALACSLYDLIQVAR